MSLTMTVPAAAPLLFQSSRPCRRSLAEKNSTPPATVGSCGLAPTGPGTWVSITVPVAVPLVRQSCRPWPGVQAVKNSSPFIAVRSCGSELAGPGARSSTSEAAGRAGWVGDGARRAACAAPGTSALPITQATATGSSKRILAIEDLRTKRQVCGKSRH